MAIEERLSYVRVAHAARRRDMINFLTELSDLELQQRLWIEKSGYPNAAGIDEVVHFFFDDTDLANDPAKEIGFILHDAAEVKTIRDVTSALNSLVARLGNSSSQRFISDPEWPTLTGLAKAALARLHRTGVSET